MVGILKQMATGPDPSAGVGCFSLLRIEKLRRYFRERSAPFKVVDGKMAFLTSKAGRSPLDVAISPSEFSSYLRAALADELQYEATDGFADRHPRESARGRAAGPIGGRTWLYVAFVLCCCVTAPQTSLAILVLSTSIYFLAVALIRIGLAIAAQARRAPNARRPLSDGQLPVITILAPLFREAHALPGLVAAISRLDYPPEKLDVKLLLERCDAETLREAHRLDLDNRFDIIVVPPSYPQTKPKACNYGLACARGDYIVIYDAEDEPETDQLKIAAEIFESGDDDLACLQARLNYYNPDENWLTRLFTIEYCLWFDHFLPALDRLGAPAPLGGTSNIFKTEILADVGGWDPYNVTEDADLGIRLARRGYKTAVFDSTTFEEANCKTGNWLRQRSRWMKGFLQTWLVHRNATGGSRDWRTTLSVDFFIGGTVFAALINPLLWAVLAVERATGYSPLGLFPEPVRSFNLLALTIGNLSFIALAAYAPWRRRLWRLGPAALLMPVYWIMMSAAAWRALIQLVHRPSFWEKTDHGLSGEAKVRRAAALAACGLERETGARHFAGATGEANRLHRSEVEAPNE